MSTYIETIQQEVVDTVKSMEEDDLLVFRQYIRLNSICRELKGVDLMNALPEDALLQVGSFLNARDVSNLQMGCKVLFQAFDSAWQVFGESKYSTILVEGKTFQGASGACWFDKYLSFAKSLRIAPRKGVIERGRNLKDVKTCIRLFRKVSCTLPTLFSVVTSGRTFIEMTVSVKFSPEAVRSVIGLIESPIKGDTESLKCDRALSRKHWGLAFGPLTGVVSSRGQYFDDFSTYRARHGLHDYLGRAMHEQVTLKVGIYIEEGKIAFYRLPEHDYPDWECTGFVFESAHVELYPCLMFSHIGHRDSIYLTVTDIRNTPPYMPHVNTKAVSRDNWSSFAEEGLDGLLAPPPNSPMMMSDTEMQDLGDL
jgi:hypothetical protein